MAFLQTGAPYKRRGSILPVYIVFRAECFSPQLSFADFDSANIKCMYVCIYVYMNVCVCLYVYIYICMYVCMYIYMNVCMYECLYVCMVICTCVRMYVCVYLYMYVCIYMYECMCACMYFFILLLHAPLLPNCDIY